MNKLMSLLMDASDVYDETKKEFVGAYAWLNPLISVLNNIVLPILIVVATAGVIYAIYLGVMMAKAEDEGKREESKKRIINLIIAIAITVVLMVVFYAVVNNLPTILSSAQDTGNSGASEENPGRFLLSLGR